MAKLNFIFGSLALVLATALTVPVAAQAANTSVTCKDGSIGKAGKGACSHHGGIDKSAKVAETSEPAKKETPATPDVSTNPADNVNCKDGSTGHKGKGACSHHGGVDKSGGAASATPDSMDAKKPAPTASTATTSAPTDKAAASSDPSDATAKCKDGTYSHSKKHSGSCSHHGGVDQFLK